MKNVAVIGCGTIAHSAHIPAYMANKEVTIKYFCDIVAEKAEKAVEEFKCGKAVTDYHEILNDPELDAVSVCVPNSFHAPITIDFLNAGKNVLCEKPCAPTYEAALSMQQARQKSGKVLNIGVVNRFNTAVNRIKNIIDAGELGEIYHVYISFRSHRSIPGWGGWFTTKEISGGGVLIDWGVHFLDLVMYCTGDPQPVSASGKAYCKLGKSLKDYTYIDMWAGPPKEEGAYDVDDFVTGFIRTEGPTFTLNGAWAQNINENEMYIDFLGTKGGIRLQYGADFKLYSTKDGALIETTSKYKVKNPFEEEINAFIECIDSGEKLPSHIDYALITAKMMQALYDSSDAGREIAL